MDSQRPTPLVEDIEGTKAKLEQWFTRQLGADDSVHIPELNIPEATGMSNVTLLFDVEYQKNGEACRDACVGRLQPEIARPVFPSYDLSLQCKAMEVVDQRIDSVPAPTVVGLETDTSLLGTAFYIMKRIDGVVPPDMPPYNMGGWLLEDCSPEQRGQLWNAGIDTMARLHRGMADNLSAFDFLEQPQPGENALQQQLRYWREYHDWGMEGIQHSICLPAMEWLEANQPKDERFAISWGDSRIGNMMFAEDYQSVVGVLDWEMITRGNPVQDLAWWIYLDRFFADGLGMPRLEGFPPHEDSIQRWSDLSGFDANEELMRYYTVFAGLRYGLILSRINIAGGNMDEVQENLATNMLAGVMESL